MYTTYEAGKRRLVNHTRAHSLASPGRGRGCGRGRGAAGRDVQVRCAEMRERFAVESIKNRDNKTLALTGE